MAGEGNHRPRRGNSHFILGPATPPTIQAPEVSMVTLRSREVHEGELGCRCRSFVPLVRFVPNW